ncbi:hypothetical protein IWZ03DRAFT_416367 [Phyllosticta citriasiana]|uniref:Nephrocystin 3-like N-terminal domain-containing protein n=1 Tax=Phyllosticta citriasiana TaxID=595635 RepID=A0ABR1KIM4_9PEZI
MESFLQSNWGAFALTAVAGLLVLDLYLRIFGATRSLAGPNVPHYNPTTSETASQVQSVVDGQKDSPRSTDAPNPSQARDQREVSPASTRDSHPSKTAEKSSGRRKLGPETVFRLEGLPMTYQGTQINESETEYIVRKALNAADGLDIFVESLARHPTTPSQTATIRFSEVPYDIDQGIQSDGVSGITYRSPKDSKSKLDLTMDTRFDGFTALYSPPETERTLDVVALPGLGGHPFWSFKARKQDFMWLRDGLRKSVPSAQVLVYGYDSHLQKSNSFQSLQDLGLNFALALMSLIKASNKESGGIRPVVLIGQSLGGLVIKEALCKLAVGRKEERDLLKSVEAVLFFGTPNSGMDISSTIPMVRGQPNEDFLRSIGRDSADLRRLAEKWEKAIDPTGDGSVSQTLKIYSFYETMQSPTAAKDEFGRWRMNGPPVVLVDRVSATHGRSWESNENSRVIAIDAPHSDMVKFKSINDGVYTNFIVPWLRDATENRSKYLEGWLSRKEEELLESCLASLSFPDQESHRHEIVDAKNHTCEWILNHDVYKEWLSSSQPLLWIEGQAGVGKSTVLKYALQDSERAPPSDAIVASYFFYGNGTDLQKTPLGLYRCLLRQIIPHFPRTFQWLLRECQERSQSGQTWTWKSEELRYSLKERLPEASKRRPITIFIDALDECPEECRDDLADFIDFLTEPSVSASLKICVSCRQYPMLYTRGIRIPVQENNEHDIDVYVKDRLSPLEDEHRPIIEQQIIDKANGVFQWAVIVCKEVMRMRKGGIRIEMILDAIDSIPEDLHLLVTGEQRKKNFTQLHEFLGRVGEFERALQDYEDVGQFPGMWIAESGRRAVDEEAPAELSYGSDDEPSGLNLFGLAHSPYVERYF